ncbi:MAG: hypothetical protein IKT50_03555 [Clostridia bacterium]|nr:hypothetical protein [Clostridia bacterium]
MRKRILSLVLALAMLVPAVAVSTSAVPYAPSSNGFKDFGQENYYMYEVTKGNAAPKADGLITEADGYGEPVSTYGYRYMTTADKAAFDFDKGEYVMNESGEYYVYPTPDSADEIWASITDFEIDNPHGYIHTYYVLDTKFSTSDTYYFVHPTTGAYVRAYFVTKETFKNYRHINSKGYYTLENAQVLTKEPADWAKNYKNYYTQPSTGGFSYVEGDTAPKWEAGKYYTGEYFTVTKFYRKFSSTAGSVGSVTSMKNSHVILPEKVNLYARYDQKYLYYAVELKEMAHKVSRYGMENWYGSTITNSPLHLFNNTSFHSTYRMSENSTIPTAAEGTTLKTYISAAQTLKAAYIPAILAKFGNPDATTLAEVQTPGVDYNIKHTPYDPSKEETTEEEGGDEFFGEEEQDYSSKKYGTTVYEYRIPWSVVNREYTPDKNATAVPDVFSLRTNIELETNLSDAAAWLSLTLPRAAYRLPGTVYYADGPYPNDLHAMRNLSSAGMEPGTYNFYWKNFSNSGDVIWKSEYFTTDYFDISALKTGTITNMPHIFYTMGQEPGEGYVKPGYEGTAIRVDGSDAQQMRIKISIPETEKEIEQAGVLVAPTEVSRRVHLKLGMSAIAYYAEEYPVFYGIIDGKWFNLTENTDAYFSTSATPNDSDSYVAHDSLGGKPSGVYTVYTLPVDLEDPYGQTTNEDDVDCDVYTTIFTGPNGEGIYDDFDDFFTFYTIRPYIKYADGTVAYGEYEYKSIYYLACWMFRDMLKAYNETVVDSSDVLLHYNMDMMPLSTVKDAAGNVVTDFDGNNIYMPKSSTSLTTDSVFAGGAENSIYWPERRLELFRWYANRTVSRANGGVAIRIENYDSYHPDVKALVDKYVELYENVWQQLVKCEQKQYFKLK